MYKSKINKINKLLEDEKSLNLYIDTLQKDNNIEIPLDLNEKILNKIEKIHINNTDEKIGENKKKEKLIKFRKLDIIKVASFTLFTVIMWNLLFSTTIPVGIDDKSFNEKMESEIKFQEKLENIQESKNDIKNKITTLFITPNIGEERGVKL